MRCDLTTCSSAHISLLVSGSVHTCVDDQLLECHIKNELIEKSQLVHALPSCEENKPSLHEPQNFICIASGASVFEVCMNVLTWAAKKRTVLLCKSFFQAWKGLSGLIRFGLVVQRKSLRVLVSSVEDDARKKLEPLSTLTGDESYQSHELVKMVELPLKFPSIFAQSPLRMRSNVLLHGPLG